MLALLSIAVVSSLGALLFAFLAWKSAKNPAPLDTTAFDAKLDRLERVLKEGFLDGRKEAGETASTARKETLEAFTQFSRSLDTRFQALGQGVEGRLQALQEDNSKKLEQMRATVDEKLQGTLEKRLGESFKLVSERLEQVHKGLGEMQSLATGVGDLKKVLTNVKTRGTWGEVQLGALLEQVLTPEQYEKNVTPKAGCGEVVEFAIRLPGRTGDKSEIVWLPIDAKFPTEDYQRLIEAQERADLVAAEAAGKQLEERIKGCAKDISTKYIHPPETTDFGILFLPTEGLYAEVLRRPGLTEFLQRQHRVTVTGPTTLGAMLNSLQMGFRTLAVEKRSSEVWTLLGAVKTEFGNYGKILEKVQKKLNEASNTIDDVRSKSNNIQTKLRKVEALPTGEVGGILGLVMEDTDAGDGEATKGES
jgi:DNA recombination protein RmuC